MTEFRLCSIGDLPEDGSPTRHEVGGRTLAVVRIDDDIYVLGDTCTHAEVSLSGGEVDVDTLELMCPKHGASFCLRTGDALTLPATRPTPTYAVRREGDDVMVEL